MFRRLIPNRWLLNQYWYGNDTRVLHWISQMIYKLKYGADVLKCMVNSSPIMQSALQLPKLEGNIIFMQIFAGNIITCSASFISIPIFKPRRIRYIRITWIILMIKCITFIQTQDPSGKTGIQSCCIAVFPVIWKTWLCSQDWRQQNMTHVLENLFRIYETVVRSIRFLRIA
jgi:hypothetical protein